MADVLPLPSLDREHVLARARARRGQRGASLFVVAITLGLLGAMGVYGLGAASSDMRAVSHLREGLHAQRVAEDAMVMSAEAFNPMTGPRLVQDLTANTTSSVCKRSARPSSGASTATQYQNVEGCLAITTDQLQKIVNGAVGGTGNWPAAATPFTSQSFFPAAATSLEQSLQPNVTIEVTNAVEAPIPPGWDENKDVFYEVTVTPVAKMAIANNSGATESTVLGRGRIVIGPARPMRRIAPAP